jgi:hypothetical protein
MATTSSTSKSNEMTSTETTPSTGASLEDAMAHKEAWRKQEEARFIKMMGETEGKAYAAKVWAKMWDEDAESEEEEDEEEACSCGTEKGKGACPECEADRDFETMSPADYDAKWRNRNPKAEAWSAKTCALREEEEHISEEQYERMKMVASQKGGQTSNATWAYASEVMEATGDHHEAFNLLWTAMGGANYAKHKTNEMKMKEKHEDARDRLRAKLEARKAKK